MRRLQPLLHTVTGERRLTELMHQHSGPATVQLVPDDRSDEEGEAAAPLPGFVPQPVHKYIHVPPTRGRPQDRCAALRRLVLGIAPLASRPRSTPPLPPQRSSLPQKFGGGSWREGGLCSPAPLPAPFLSPRQVATAPLVERMGSKQAVVVPNPLRRSARWSTTVVVVEP